MIELRNVSLIYKDNIILKDINLIVSNSERLVILGSSGSGKTSLLRLIAGFIAPASGEILIDGDIVSKEGKIIVPPDKREVAMVFQDLALWPHMNVYENIAFGLKLRKIAKNIREEKVKEMLSLVDLTGYEKRRIEELSGGQQQRVALARALILSPKVLLMDEPLSSLDKTLNKKLRKEIIKLQEEFGFTLVYVTHNEEEAEEIGTRIITLDTP
jgi:ABC-type Fe3+/spermidine/putrescine transport system ATPase subunit